MIGFIILFGTKGIESTVDSGVFLCPTCRCQRPYTRKVVKRWFTLFFIPVLPLGEAGRFVSCDHCGVSYDEKVLGQSQQAIADEQAFLSWYHFAVRRIMIFVAASDGVVDQADRQTIRSIYQQMTGHTLMEPEFDSEVAAVSASEFTLKGLLGDQAPRLNTPTKQQMLRAGFAVAHADGQVDAGEVKALSAVGAALQVGRPEFEQVMSEYGGGRPPGWI